MSKQTNSKSNREEEFALMQRIAAGDAKAFETFNDNCDRKQGSQSMI